MQQHKHMISHQCIYQRCASVIHSARRAGITSSVHVHRIIVEVVEHYIKDQYSFPCYSDMFEADELTEGLLGSHPLLVSNPGVAYQANPKGPFQLL